MGRIKHIKTVSASLKAVNEILVKEKPVIGVKCLGCNVGEHGGEITLVAVSCWDGQVYVYDLRTCKAIMFDGGLLRLFQSAELLKVFHDCAPDSATLTKQFSLKLRNFFDTRVAYSIVMERSGLSPRLVSFIKLCEVYKQPLHQPSYDFQRLLIEDPNVWARRPCTGDMLSVAASYVKPLVPTLFTELDVMLPPDTDEWFLHQCEETRNSMLRPGSLKSGQKIKCSKDHTSGVKNLFGTHFCICPSCVSNMGTSQTYRETCVESD
ncbi:piRNA biogenesis protein EXD1-like [Ruditapes philippinarum]|uniref:piRNA biogenesis protein EXD1-like n=1 Tax=Ruditapes philippinarum TaxID=129788 RepID=UPI00295B214B|nr:piRNA biogenesis protein EXD1-like [Ruditapes philippinarum]XP_060603438.1 piRNA biogenesis protein EXD1-like [Ruditapes philippinarum]